MTRREKQLAAAGVAAGLLAAAIVGSVFFLRSGEPEHTAPAPPAASEPAPTMHGPAASESTAVQLTEEEQRAIGVETTEVRLESILRTLTAPGRVEEAETALRTVSARVGGRIDRLFINFTGQAVRKDEPVALIYSPAIVTTAEEYRLALDNRRRLSGSREQFAVSQAEELVEASRRRLELWGLTADQIETLAASPEAPIHMTTYSPAAGIVTNRNVTEGQYVSEGDVLFTVVDLSTVWVKADVYEPDIPQIRTGRSVTITTAAIPGVNLRGNVNFIEPVVNQQTRTIPVRIQVANPQARLRPGMFVNAAFAAGGGANALAVPRSAVIDTGTEKIVYLAKGGGVFERKPVELGAPGADSYPVISGLSAGDRVVTHGAFLIDSQTRLTAGMTGLFGGSKEFDRAAAPGVKVGFRTEPDPPAGATENNIRVTVSDPSGQPIRDAQVKVTIIMPAMPSMGMPEMRGSADLSWNGSEYTGKLNVPMAGPWNVTVDVRRDGQLLAAHRTRFDAR